MSQYLRLFPNLCLTLVFVASCATGRFYPPSQKHRERSDFVAEGRNGMISTSHPLASEAGLKMLKMGGNAMDAATAASFVISVVRPQSTGLGGGGFALYFNADAKQTSVYDFRERAPAKARRDMYLDAKGDEKDFTYNNQKIPNASVNGHLAVATPGLVAGLIDAHKQHGKLPLATVIQPAIDIARGGFPVYKSLAEDIEKRQEVMKKFEGTAQIFYPQGKGLRIGDKLIQNDLAWTLEQIKAKGKSGFYDGEVARRLLAEIKRGKGILTKADLRNYRVKNRTPITGTYRGYTLVSMPPPSSGGVHIIEMLNILSGYDLKSMGHNEPASVHIIAETMRRAFADRAEYLGDPDFVKVPVLGLTDKKYAERLRASINKNKATPSNKVKAGNPSGAESPSTTHLSVVDKWGNAVSTTQTVNFTFGSCVVAQGTGVVLNDEMDDFSKKPGIANNFGLLGNEANAIAANKTMLSSMSPTLVFGKDGRIEMVVGSPGGPRIITATLQTIINYIDYNMDLPDAVHSYRIHHQWYPDEIRIEADGLDDGTISSLEKMGHKISVNEGIGDVSAIARSPSAGWVGVSDTRFEGKPKGY